MYKNNPEHKTDFRLKRNLLEAFILIKQFSFDVILKKKVRQPSMCPICLLCYIIDYAYM